MTDSTSVQSGLATLGPAGWSSVESYTKNKIIVPSDYGAFGGGSNDESALLQLAINDANANRYPLVLPNKATYLVGTPLQLKSDLEIIGAGAAFGYTRFQSAGDNAILTNTAGQIIRLTLRNFMLDHRGGHNGTSYALDLVDANMMEFDNVRITSGTSTLRNFQGLRIRKSDSLRFLNFHITECRGRSYSIGYNAAQIAFFGSSFECDTGAQVSWSEIDAYALHGDAAPTNYQGNGEGIQFFGCQHERVNVYVNAPGVIFDNGGGGAVNIQFDKQSRRISLRGMVMSLNHINVCSPAIEMSNIDANTGSLSGAINWESANLADGLFRVYGAGREYLILAVVQARTVTVTGAGCTFAGDVAGIIESSDTLNLLQMQSVTTAMTSRDQFCWPTLLEVPAGNNYLTAAAVGTQAALKLYAYLNLLVNGDFTAGTAITGWTATNCTPIFAGGYVQFNATAANMRIRQLAVPGIKTGRKYLLMARCKGTNVQLAMGDVTDGTAGSREAMASTVGIRTAQYADGSYILSCIFEATGARTDVSVGYLGTPVDQPQVKWMGIVDLGTEAPERASTSQPFAASFTPVYQSGKLEQTIRVGVMTANMTALNLGTTTPLAVDDLVTFVFKQDATAGRTIVWNASYVFQVLFVAAVLTTDANKFSTVTFRWDGTSMRQVSPVNAWIA